MVRPRVTEVQRTAGAELAPSPNDVTKVRLSIHRGRCETRHVVRPRVTEVRANDSQGGEVARGVDVCDEGWVDLHLHDVEVGVRAIERERPFPQAPLE